MCFKSLCNMGSQGEEEGGREGREPVALSGVFLCLENPGEKNRDVSTLRFIGR